MYWTFLVLFFLFETQPHPFVDHLTSNKVLMQSAAFSLLKHSDHLDFILILRQLTSRSITLLSNLIEFSQVISGGKPLCQRFLHDIDIL